MNKKLIFLLTMVILGASLVFNFNTKAGTDLTGHKIVLDAGHGGDELGSTACVGLDEKDANYDIALRLKNKLEEDGAIVYLTRDQDGDLVDDLIDGGKYDNEDRYTYANSTDAEVLISIHLNGSDDPTVNGSTNYYSKPKKDKEFTTVMHSGMANYLNGLVDWLVKDFGITNFMSGVTLRFNGPAVLTEPLYISNTNECNALKASTGKRQDEIVQVLYDGLLRWFDDDYNSVTVIGKKDR
jgi:N-acetylmuramoyl-L-alanine amidase